MKKRQYFCNGFFAKGDRVAQQYTYRLGIDIGIASLGTALVQVDENGTPLRLLDAGVRTFAAVSRGAEDRRLKRQQRKTIRRRRQRLHALLVLLRGHDLLPADPVALARLMRRSPYALRARAAVQKLASPHELGRCLLHLAKFRGAGFLHQQEEDKDGNAAKDRQKSAIAYRELEQRLRESGQTVGQYCQQRLQDATVHGRVRRRAAHLSDGSVDFAIPRFLVKKEFFHIWQQQAAHFPQLTDALRQQVYEVIFRDRPHAPYATGLCSLDPDSGEERLPRLSRLAELCRIYQQINNLRLRTRTGILPLTRPQRDALVACCLKGQDLTRTKIKRLLAPLHDETIEAVNMPDKATTIKGLCHVAAFAHIPAWNAMSEAEQDDLLAFIADPRLPGAQGQLMPEDDFLAQCARRLHLDGEDAAERVSRCCNMLPTGRSMLGKTATRRILDVLREGRTITLDDGQQVWRPVSQREAADMCGYLAEEERSRQQAGSFARLPYYGQLLRHDVLPVHPWHVRHATEEEARYGRIPNPVVHVALNQLRKVVNEILDLYGTPQSIHIELAREFGLSAKARDELAKEQKKRQAENETIDRELLGMGLPPDRKNRLKYRLWTEQKHYDIYTQQSIAASELASCDIDHIIPRSAGGTDTYNNLALTSEQENKKKGNSFASDFIQSHYPDQWPHILAFISDKKYPRGKAWRFLPDARLRYQTEGDDDSTDRALSDTGHMAKMAARYLRAICPDILLPRGAMTARLRHIWGLDGLEYELLGLDVRKNLYDPQSGEVQLDAFGRIQRNPAWQAKPRADHRHHALDAVVLACTSRRLLTMMARAQRQGQPCTDIPAPFGGSADKFRRMVRDGLERVRVSPKPEHGLDGSLHEETRYRVLQAVGRQPGLYTAVYQKPLAGLTSRKNVEELLVDRETFGHIPTVADIAARNAQKCQAILERMEEARTLLQQRQQAGTAEGRKATRITEALVVQEAIRLARAHWPGLGASYQSIENLTLVAVSTKRQCGYKPGNNVRMDFYEKANGEVGWACISRFAANQPGFVPPWQEEGGRLLWSLWKGDVLELTPTDRLRATLPPAMRQNAALWCIVQIFSANRLQVKLLQDARPLQGDSETARCWLSGECRLKTFTLGQARRVDLSPFGKVLHKHKKLWHGKKTRPAR